METPETVVEVEADGGEQRPLLPPVEASGRKLVLEYTSGPLKGLFRIFGTAEGSNYPRFLEGPFVLAENETSPVMFASLIKVTPRAVYYREVVDRSGMSGRLDDFFPGIAPGSMDPNQI